MSKRFEGPPPSVLKDEKHLCNPTCSLFRCSKNALVIKQEYSRGRVIRVTFCRWVGDRCTGWRCQYSYCVRRALLPDGKCSLALQVIAKGRKDMLDELKELELESKSLKERLSKKVRKYVDLDEF